MVKKTIVKRLIALLIVVGIISAGVFTVLMNYNEEKSMATAAELGSMYMSEMMFQMQDHFKTIVEIKNNEALHVSSHAMYCKCYDDFEDALRSEAEKMDFEYLALYDENGNYDILFGESVWYRDLEGFLENIVAGESTATTGYLTSSSDRYIVFGIPAEYEMASGQMSIAMLVGFSVDMLYDYINIDVFEQLGRNASLGIILTNGSYILKSEERTETSFFDYISKFGSFVGMEVSEGVQNIETAMASGETFSNMVLLNGVQNHIYGAPAGEPDDWYFVIAMPQSASDIAINAQSNTILYSFVIAGVIILLLFFGVFIFYMNVSMRQIKEIEEARAEAETANKAKSVFLSNMSHDIRTPMNAIVGFATIIEDSVESKNYERVKEYLEKIKRSSEYLRSLICDVLDMSKIESGMLTLIDEPMSLYEMTDMITEIANTQTASKSQTFDLNVHDVIHEGIRADYTRLNQVLINLISNAVKFTPNGGNIKFEMWQELSEKGEQYIKTCFIVKDNGMGMSKQFIDIMFESFVREESKVRKVEGTGLGLTIVKSLVDMMGGTIEVESKEGLGSSFLVKIDFIKEDCGRKLNAKLSRVDNTKGMRILLAEDNDFNYDIAYILLGENGFVVERAENGKEAVYKYCENPSYWDAILMDLRMPVLDGYKATEKIRDFEETLPEKPHIPILAVSADVFAEDIEHCIMIGMDGHISKPIDIKELLDTLSMHLKNRN